jgi:hypothetical protein
MANHVLGIGGMIAGVVGLAVLMFGEGGWNPRTQACAALIAGGFTAALVAYLRGAKENYARLAEDVGLRHVRSYNFSVAFEGTLDGIPARFEFSPGDEDDEHYYLELIYKNALPTQLRFDVSGTNVLTRDLGGMLEGLSPLPCDLPWLKERAVYGEPADWTLDVLKRCGGFPEFTEQKWQWLSAGGGDGELRLKFRNPRFTFKDDWLRGAAQAARVLAGRLR